MNQPVSDDERALPPQQMLRLIDENEAAALRLLRGNPLVFFGPWGAAWLLGFGALFLHYGLHGEPYLPIGQGGALAVLFGGMLAAGAVTAYALRRSTAHIRGASQDRGMMYGLSWTAGFIVVGAIASRYAVPARLGEQEIGLLWSSLSLLVVGLLYMAGGAVWRWWPMFFIGVGLCVLNVIGVVAGPGWHALLSSVGGGGGFLVTGWVLSRWSWGGP